ncbi:hypothetical protein L2E82_35150 [Cichorium intybus]|uniref:Uncharacterized protein n=1 Tax=Cichorium intybus TaxID=13427 RepID=A0ACB9BNK5_CICIN|nr:hypothetical protein L2E82_35150 [Cichorium intybus]
MARVPEDQPALIDIMDPDRASIPLAGDPYFPTDVPMAPIELSDDEDPSEDEEENEPEEVEETDDEGILEDAQRDNDPADDEENLIDKEFVPSSPRRPCYQPYRSHDKSPLLMRTPRKNVVLKRKPTLSHEPTWLANLLVQRRTADNPPRFEIGESSQAPLHNGPMTQGNRLLADRVHYLEELFRATGTTSKAIEQRIERLEEEEKDDTDAIQTLYHRMGASRAAANTLGAHIRALEYRALVTERRLDAIENRAVVAEQRQCQLQEQFDELVRYLGTRLA